MFSVCSKAVNNLQKGPYFIDAAVKLALEHLLMTMYIYIYIWSKIHVFIIPRIGYEIIAQSS